MPEYLYPGVYVEEVDTGNKPIEGVSTSTAGFLGIAERGPLTPTFLTSFTDFTSIFGGYVNDSGADRYLSYAVEGFFQNGGERCFVMRVAQSPPPSTQNPTSVPPWTPPSPPYASLTSQDGFMRVQAIGPGLWGNRIAVQTASAGLPVKSDLFRLIVAYWSNGLPDDKPIPDLRQPLPKDYPPPTVVESFDDLSANPASSTFYVSQVNGVSNLVTVTRLESGQPIIEASLDSPLTSPLVSFGAVALQNGIDGTNITTTITPEDFTGELSGPEEKIGLLALADVDEISILCCPDEFYFPEDSSNSLIRNGLVDQCENLKYRFAILQAPLAVRRPETNDPTISSQRGYAAFYFPWLQITNPISGVPLLVPPGGHLAGIYARSDTNRGVHKDPANE